MTSLTAAASDRSTATRHLIEISPRIAQAAQAMAGRFREGGRLLVFGTGRAANDAEHVAVEFVHPVIVGKRALPALSLTGDVATLSGLASGPDPAAMFAHQIRLLARPQDMAMGICGGASEPALQQALDAAGRGGLLTVALVGGRADPADPAAGGGDGQAAAVDFRLEAGSSDPLVVKELQVTTYHVLWELVHVFLDHLDGDDR